MMSDQKLRIRFRKTGDLRWISHRDLARAFERLFRRIELPLAMSEGFHPHARINFPSALSVGINGDAEWVEVMLSESVSENVQQDLVDAAPEGLEIVDVQILDRSHPKPQVEWTSYEVEVPPQRHVACTEAINSLLERDEYLITREKAKQPIDLRASLMQLKLEDGRLRFSLRASRTAQARARDILVALQLDDLEQLGHPLTRTEVHLQESSF